MNNVVKKLSGFDSSKWKDLGVQADVPHSQLSTIATNVAGRADAQKEALSSTVDYWLRNDLTASWEKLATAVEKCDHAVLANKIRRSVGIVVLGKLTACTCSYMKSMPHAVSTTYMENYTNFTHYVAHIQLMYQRPGNSSKWHALDTIC